MTIIKNDKRFAEMALVRSGRCPFSRKPEKDGQQYGVGG
jgi:hypothetical protein